MPEDSPTARTLLTLELIQARPGVSGARLAERLGVSDRAARRYVAILREAGIPVESTPGRDGGYRVGRGYRVPPLMFSTAEALALVMAVLEGGHRAADPDDPVGSALGKLTRVLPAPVAGPVQGLRDVRPSDADAPEAHPDPETTAALVRASAAGRRVRLGYRLRPDEETVMDLDPWGLCLRHGRWYLLGWSHTKDAQRVLRVDRISRVTTLLDTFVAPEGLDPALAVAEHLAHGWRYAVEIVVDAPVEAVAGWIPRSLGRLEPIDADHTRVVASTGEPAWYARHLTMIEAPFQIVCPPELRDSAYLLGQRLTQAAADLC